MIEAVFLERQQLPLSFLVKKALSSSSKTSSGGTAHSSSNSFIKDIKALTKFQQFELKTKLLIERENSKVRHTIS